MATRTGSGRAAGSNSKQVAGQAARKAMEALGDAKPSFGFLFASPSLLLGDCLAIARDIARGADILACTTAGEITEEGLGHGGVAVLLVASDGAHHAGSIAGLKEDPRSAGRELCQAFHNEFQRARGKGLVCSTTVTLVDGLSGSGEKFVESIVDNTEALHQVVGGAAGDEGRFVATHVGEGKRAGPDRAAALHIFSATPWGIGVGHGLEATTGKMRVTRAKANIISEIDGKPAFSVYQEHARNRGITLTPANAGEYMIANELGVVVAGAVSRARAPLSVGPDGSLTCAADVPQGAHVVILDGKAASMVEAARNAAREALANLQGGEPAGVLLFDCICRGMILKDGFQQEIDAVCGVMGDVPLAGFLTYGEIASYSGCLESWHNTTAVAVAIPR